MDKIVEALSKLLPKEKIEPASKAVKEFLENAKQELESEASKRLEEAYAQVSAELKSEEKKAEAGYQEAYAIIQDLRNRLETQKVEFEKALEEGYEEAYQMLLAERNKNETLEVDIYEEYDKKLVDMKNYMVDKVDQFLQYKGQEIYEQARRDVVNDPRSAEHRVALDKIVDVVSEYISDDDFGAVTNSKLEETKRKIEELEGHKRILEARNIRLSTDINKLNESVRQLQDSVVNESVKHEKQERVGKAKKATGRGEVVTEGTRVISEYSEVAEPKEQQDTTLVEGNEEFFHQMQVLSGLGKKD